MINHVKTWLLAYSIFLVIDLLWLGIIASSLYNEFLGEFLAAEPIWPAAILFYILFVIGLQYFAINPALKQKSTKLAIKNGALFGFFTYMTYELTNYAVISNWPLGIVPIDILWGAVLGGSVAWITTIICIKKGAK